MSKRYKSKQFVEPAANTSPEAVMLRTAALHFGRRLDDDCEPDMEDREGQKLNRALLDAALKYAIRVADGDSSFSGFTGKAANAFLSQPSGVPVLASKLAKTALEMLDPKKKLSKHEGGILAMTMAMVLLDDRDDSKDE